MSDFSFDFCLEDNSMEITGIEDKALFSEDRDLLSSIPGNREAEGKESSEILCPFGGIFQENPFQNNNSSSAAEVCSETAFKQILSTNTAFAPVIVGRVTFWRIKVQTTSAFDLIPGVYEGTFDDFTNYFQTQNNYGKVD